MDTQQAKHTDGMVYKCMAAVMKDSSANAAGESGITLSTRPPSASVRSTSSVRSISISRSSSWSCAAAGVPASSPGGRQADDVRPITPRPNEVLQPSSPMRVLRASAGILTGNHRQQTSAGSQGGAPVVALPPYPDSTAPNGREHERYYFKDGNVTFLLEDVLFRVHRFFFERDSARFRDVILKDLNSDPRDVIVRLTDCTAVDFERFLGVLYPVAFHQHDATTMDEWRSILALSTQWGFESIRLLAIREVFSLASPIDKIVLGRQYDIRVWLPDAYEAVCLREDPLSDEEAERIGAKDTARVARLRERRMLSPDLGASDSEARLRSLMEAEFHLHLPVKICDSEKNSDPEYGTRTDDSTFPAFALAQPISPPPSTAPELQSIQESGSLAEEKRLSLPPSQRCSSQDAEVQNFPVTRSSALPASGKDQQCCMCGICKRAQYREIAAGVDTRF